MSHKIEITVLEHEEVRGFTPETATVKTKLFGVDREFNLQNGYIYHPTDTPDPLFTCFNSVGDDEDIQHLFESEAADIDNDLVNYFNEHYKYATLSLEALQEAFDHMRACIDKCNSYQ